MENMKIMDYGRRKLFRMVDSLVCLGEFLKFISSSSSKQALLSLFFQYLVEGAAEATK